MQMFEENKLSYTKAICVVPVGLRHVNRPWFSAFYLFSIDVAQVCAKWHILQLKRSTVLPYHTTQCLTEAREIHHCFHDSKV